jgi:NADH-quinone oxidoreductase subunit I
MPGLINTLEAFSSTLRNLGRPRVTEPLPWKQRRAHPERYRASFALLRDEHGEERCIGCAACAKICPSQIIRLEKGEMRLHPITGKKRASASAFTIDLQACIFCELCVQVCPTDALTMTPSWQDPTFSREDLLLGMARLYQNGATEPQSWASGSRLAAMQDPKRGQVAPTSEVKE